MHWLLFSQMQQPRWSESTIAHLGGPRDVFQLLMQPLRVVYRRPSGCLRCARGALLGCVQACLLLIIVVVNAACCARFQAQRCFLCSRLRSTIEAQVSGLGDNRYEMLSLVVLGATQSPKGALLQVCGVLAARQQTIMIILENYGLQMSQKETSVQFCHLLCQRAVLLLIAGSRHSCKVSSISFSVCTRSDTASLCQYREGDL
jgi:hypothetical protein